MTANELTGWPYCMCERPIRFDISYFSEELHIKVDFQTNTVWKTRENLRSEMTQRVFLQIPKPQFLSNIVNNVFGALGGTLNWFETGSLHFHVKCSTDSLETIRKAVQDGIVAMQLSEILLTDDVLIGDNLGGISFMAAIDDSDVSEYSGEYTHTHPDCSDWLRRSHITQYCCGNCKMAHLWGYHEDTVSLLWPRRYSNLH